MLPPILATVGEGADNTARPFCYLPATPQRSSPYKNCLAAQRCALPCRAMPRLPHPAAPSHTPPYLAQPCQTCLTPPGLATPGLTAPHRARPRLAKPRRACQTAPYHALPYRAKPDLAMPATLGGFAHDVIKFVNGVNHR